MKKKIVIITGNELRHKFFASFFSKAQGIKLIKCFHENVPKLRDNIEFKKNKFYRQHVNLRKKVEKNFFQKYVKSNKNYQKKFIKKGEINNKNIINEIISLKPQYLISYGCSIIKQELIEKFKNNFINIHLGLSPYYRGSGTNFFPFVNNEIQFCGSTIMKISKGIDKGAIIHQSRPKIYLNDNIHSIGNRIILNTANDLKKIITLKKKIKTKKLITNFKTKYYKRKDFTIESLKKAYENLNSGLIKSYLKKENILKKKYKIIKTL